MSIPLLSARTTRLAALGGIVGPVAFVGTWIASAAATSVAYSSIDDAISRLAAVGADTRWLMTTGFVVFGLSLPLYAIALRSTVAGTAWTTAAATGIATLAVAATPLDHSDTLDQLHGICATVGYATLAATPLLAARPLATSGHRLLSRLGVGAGVTAAIALALTPTSLPTGLFQRLGLTVGDAWIVTTAIAMTTGRLPTRRAAR